MVIVAAARIDGVSAQEYVRQGRNDEGMIGLVSMNELIDSAASIVQATVVSIEKPTWNSADGEDWLSEFEKDPYAFDTVPTVLTEARVHVDGVVSDGAEQTTAPALKSGDEITVWFTDWPTLELVPAQALEQGLTPATRGRYLVPGESRLLFLLWTPLYMKDGPSPQVWFADHQQAMWFVSESGVVTPSTEDANFALIGIAQTEPLSPVEVGPANWGITLDDLTRLVAAERAPGVDLDWRAEEAAHEWNLSQLAAEEGVPILPTDTTVP